MRERDDGGELAQIWAEHRPLTVERVTVLDRAATAAAAGILTDQLRDAARREAHTLAGSVAIFGFLNASRIAHDLEQRYGAVPPPADAADLAALAAALRDAIDRPMPRPER